MKNADDFVKEFEAFEAEAKRRSASRLWPTVGYAFRFLVIASGLLALAFNMPDISEIPIGQLTLRQIFGNLVLVALIGLGIAWLFKAPGQETARSWAAWLVAFMIFASFGALFIWRWGVQY